MSERGVEHGGPAAGRVWPTWRAIAAVIGLAVLPSVGTIGAPWIADDAAILARVAEDGPWADWTRSQYGLHFVRFWRPVVSTSWALQEAMTGIAVEPLRLFNLALHALCALLTFGVARRIGAGTGAAWFAGMWVALFPEQGGTVTWLAGRTDLLCAVFLLASTWTALGPRPLASAPLAFLACASKEFGFLAPLWALLFARASAGWGASLRRAAPAAAGAAAALLWRRAALGQFGGGYPAELPGLGAGLSGATQAVLVSWWPSLTMLGALVVAGVAARVVDRRALVAAALAALSGLVPLYQLLASGQLEPQNRRLLFVAECGLALVTACAWRAAEPPVRGRWNRVWALLVVPVVAVRIALAWSDTREWKLAASFGEQQVTAARFAVGRAEPAPYPVLFPGFESSRSGAYCLGFGLADRFRAPFPGSPRPVWPWRPMFAPSRERIREALVDPRRGEFGYDLALQDVGGSIWPLDDRSRVAPLAVTSADGAPVTSATIDERAILASEDRSPRLTVGGGPAGAALEAVLYTEVGYEPYPCGTLDADGSATFSLMQLLTLTNGISAADAFRHAADLGATRAYLELRVLDARGEVLAASPWIELTWPPELLERSFSGG